MSSITDTVHQVRDSADLPDALLTAWHAFEEMLAEIQAWQDPDIPLFTAFVMAAGYAADGRDAILFAPSLPGAARQVPSVHPVEQTAEQAAGALVSLCEVLISRLSRAAGAVVGSDDREACREAAQSACVVRDLLAGTGR